MQSERIQDLEVLLGHTFRDKDYLINALSHSSIKTEKRPSNERLEFLGDSVLGLIISDALYRRFPDDDEGTLTRIKGQAVSRSTLQRVAVVMGFDRFILVGKGVAKKEIPASLLGNLFEAIVGAIYLDAGLAASRKFILRHLNVVLEAIVDDRAERNYKSMLQHHCQREMGAVPIYRVLREVGPAHNRAFDVAVLANGKEFGRARGISKKEAEQGAARAAMIYLRAVEENPKQPVRGAGTILCVGVDGTQRKRVSRRGERKVVEAPGPGQETPGSRRKSSSRRTHRSATAERPAPEQEPEQEAQPAARKKRKRTARKKKSAAAKKTTPAKSAEKPAEAPAAEAAPKKSRRRRRRKKSTGGGESEAASS